MAWEGLQFDCTCFYPSRDGVQGAELWPVKTTTFIIKDALTWNFTPHRSERLGSRQHAAPFSCIESHLLGKRTVWCAGRSSPRPHLGMSCCQLALACTLRLYDARCSVFTKVSLKHQGLQARLVKPSVGCHVIQGTYTFTIRLPG